MKKNLTQIKKNQKCKVLDIEGGPGIYKKLLNLGIRPGVEITKKSSISSRGPIIIQIGNTQLAIGFGIAKKILVITEESK